jgi:hypothetical protein
VPASVLTFEAAGEGSRQAEFTILARVRNAAGEIVHKSSQPYGLSLRADATLSENRDDVLFYRAPELPPGEYTLEAIVYDARSHKAGARVIRFDVPAMPKDALQLGGLLLVRRSEPLRNDEEGIDHPLRYDQLLLVPNLGEPLSRSADKVVSFYAAALLPEGAPLPDAELELALRGQAAALTRLPLERAYPDAEGRVQFVGKLTLESIPAGEYELRLAVTCGDQKEARSVRMNVID